MVSSANGKAGKDYFYSILNDTHGIIGVRFLSIQFPRPVMGTHALTCGD